jgi:Fas apoptotic inhibitory molecule (FAIM1)
MTKQWKIALDGKEYTVNLEHNPWTNVKEIHVNNHVIYASPGKLQVGGVTCFVIEGHECAVIITNKFLGFDYDLVVDGVSAITRKSVKYQTVNPMATMVNGVIQPSLESKNQEE